MGADFKVAISQGVLDSEKCRINAAGRQMGKLGVDNGYIGVLELGIVEKCLNI